MFKGLVKFQAAFSGVEFEAIEITPSYPDIVKATIASTPMPMPSSPEEGTILLTVDVTGADTFHDAIHKAEEFALHVAKLLTFEFGVFHQRFRHVGDILVEEQSQPDGSIKTIHHLSDGISTGCTAYFRAKPSIEKVKSILEEKPRSDCLYSDLFYFALGLTDPLSKFMVLYLIVLTLCEDNQKKVDQCVLKIQLTVSTNPRHKPLGKSKKEFGETPETLYTRLRNQVSHVRPETTIETTKSEMEQSLSDFIKVTKEVINQTLSKA